MNDTFLQLVRTETHRGLEGRALGGFWTGGRVYGYPTIKEPNPTPTPYVLSGLLQFAASTRPSQSPQPAARASAFRSSSNFSCNS